MSFATSKGTYTASVDFPKTAWRVYNLEEPYAGTAEYWLQTAGDRYVISLKNLPPNKNTAWLQAEQPFRGIGFMNQNQQFGTANLKREYDAVFFVKETEHSKSYMLK